MIASSGAQAGLRAGDRIDTRHLGMHERLHLMVTGAADRMQVPAMVAGRPRMVTIAPMPAARPSTAAYLRIVALAAFLAIGLWALWHGRDAASLGLGIFFAAMPSLFLPGTHRSHRCRIAPSDHLGKNELKCHRY